MQFCGKRGMEIVSMAASRDFVSVVVILIALVVQGTGGQCTKADLKLSQIGLGSDVKGKPEWKVTLTNDCFCAFTHIKLGCERFLAVDKIDPSLLTRSGDECLVADAIGPYSSLSFTYAWDAPFPFVIKSSLLICL
ncbi:hypothetical protein Nepgr_000811 [Nepenthes gracilis]|uniref:Uncharacterized protein n=1 Tax=Nepenthes gracilis TaxID=150966 RepID=A0AAD3P7E9_NEPGR|nr:hypothetical protein Nepgr_000811 [Nepenthes gracilis]